MGWFPPARLGVSFNFLEELSFQHLRAFGKSILIALFSIYQRYLVINLPEWWKSGRHRLE